MEIIKIDIINLDGSSFFTINSNVKEIFDNKRIYYSFKRLNAEFLVDEIRIPFLNVNKIQILDELQSLLIKFDFTIETSQEVKNDVTSYERENKMFSIFSKKAYSIRNDEFDIFPELIEDFKEFKESQKKHFKRSLYLLQELSAFHLSFAQNACNFSVPGAGKTAIVYSAYAYLKNLPIENEKHIDKLVVIGPLSSFAPWENEYEECF